MINQPGTQIKWDYIYCLISNRSNKQIDQCVNCPYEERWKTIRDSMLQEQSIRVQVKRVSYIVHTFSKRSAKYTGRKTYQRSYRLNRSSPMSQRELLQSGKIGRRLSTPRRCPRLSRRYFSWLFHQGYELTSRSYVKENSKSTTSNVHITFNPYLEKSQP